MKTEQFTSINKELTFRILGGITDPNNDEDEDMDEDAATDVATPANSTGTSTNPAPRRTR